MGMIVDSKPVGYSNTYFWAIAFLPLLLGLADLVFSASFSPEVSSTVSVLSALALNVALVFADSKQLQRSGIYSNPMLGVIFVPLYLFKRAKLTSSTQKGLLLWIASLVMSMLLSVLGSSFIGSQVSTASTEAAIKNWLVQSSLADSSVTVTCPDTILAKPGATFICTADTVPADTLEVTIKNEQGDLTWQIIG
jgi:hypothetical protein